MRAGERTWGRGSSEEVPGAPKTDYTSELLSAISRPAMFSLQRNTMASEDEWNEFIAASARALALTVEPAWYPAVRTNLATIWKLAGLVEGFELPDDAEPAPVFRA
jgi:hypothetical protein